jgi:hypothetical protein
MDMNAAGALHAYARQSAQALTGSGSQAQSRRLAQSQAATAEPRTSVQPVAAPARQPLLTSGLDLLA